MVPVHLPMAPPARWGQDLSTAPTPAAAFAESPGLVGTETAPGWAGLGWAGLLGHCRQLALVWEETSGFY